MNAYGGRARRSVDSVSRRRFLVGGAAAATSATLAGSVRAGFIPAALARADEPAIDPGFVAPQYYDDRETSALLDVIEKGSPFRYWGPSRPEHTQRFEENYARHMGARYALAVTSGTAALDCAVAGLEIGPGDEVIVPAYTWWSDYTCVVHAGAVPVFAEIDRSLCLSPEDFANKITRRTKAVIAVHLLGGPCDMGPILETARKKGVAVLEDAAQCVGGSFGGKKLGTLGDVGIYSFQLNKMISSGEGGALVTDNPILYERAARFHDMGTIRKVFLDRTGGSKVVTFAGENFRMSELTAAVLGAQLPKLDDMVESLRRVADRVRQGIRDVPGIRLRHRPDPAGDIGYAVFFELPGRESRNHAIGQLRARGIPAGTLSGSVLLPVERSIVEKRTRHPEWPSFRSGNGKAIRYGPECCPKTRGILDRFVQVRMGPRYTDEAVDRIVSAIREIHPKVS